MQKEEHDRYLRLIQLDAPVYIDEEGLEHLRLYSRTLTNLDAASVVQKIQYVAAIEAARCSRDQAVFEAPAIAGENANAGNVRFHLATRMASHAYSQWAECLVTCTHWKSIVYIVVPCSLMFLPFYRSSSCPSAVLL